jgi:hypothetical protein
MKDPKPIVSQFISGYKLLVSTNDNFFPSQERIYLRKNTSPVSNKLVKIAFDTRHIDQETDINPRRNLQYYHRSEPFISETMDSKLKKLLKLHSAVDELKQEYGKEIEWQDSNARILLTSLDNGLRVKQGDGDFSETQNVQGGLKYIEDILYLRYRLGYDELEKISKNDLKKIILCRDEPLLRKEIYNSYICANSKISNIVKTTDATPKDLIQQLFGEVRATAEQPNITRSITITINDKLTKD